MRPSRLVAAAAAALLTVGVLTLAACSDSESTETVTVTAPASTATAPSSTTPTVTAVADAEPADLEVWQADLKAVGCYAGEIDGTLGPQTEAAITAFQEAQGLAVDGKLGPETEGALEDAVAADETVCDTPASVSSTTESGNEDDGAGALGGEATVSSASYDKSFSLSSCSLNADVSNISLRGSADGLTLAVDATGGSGTLAVGGGNEQDGITVNGTVTGVDIAADRSFTATGRYTQPNFAGENFTISGACPE